MNMLLFLQPYPEACLSLPGLLQVLPTMKVRFITMPGMKFV